MLHTMIQWIALHGYGVIYAVLALGIIGLPVPDELILAYIGHLIYKGSLRPTPAFAAAFLGSISGMTLNYGLGRIFGPYLIGKFGRFMHLTPDKMDRMHDWYEHSGKWALFLGYFLPGLRHVSAVVAGTSKMHIGEFAFFAYSGGLAWSIVFIGIGFYLQENWARETERIHYILLGCTAAVVVFAAVYLLIKDRGKKKGAGRKTGV
jgi:membrane protein DedA with SNARE-associated domain